jgi:aspartate aminotransferase
MAAFCCAQDRNKMEKYLAQRTQLIDASGIRRIWNIAATIKDPIDFSIGQPDFDVPEPLKAEAIAAIQSGQNRYSLTAGDPELVSAIQGKVTAEFGWQEPATMVASGVSGAMLLIFMSMIDPGDEVILPDPYFVMYKHLIKMLGGKCVFVDSYPDFRLPVEGIAKAITPKTKLIVAVSPSNPTGAVCSVEELKALAAVAAKTGAIVLSDEIYNKFCYDGPCPSMASYYERTILMRGFSKSYGMPGWRLAYVATHESLRPLLDEMTKIQQYTFVCAPTPFQKAAIKALDYDMSGTINAYKRKRDMIYNGLKDKFEVVKPGGSFYTFVKAPGGNASEFVEKAIRNKVLVIPGNVFSEKDTHFRISYTTSDEKIAKGVEILRSIA